MTLDITGLFTNIPQDETSQGAGEALSERENKSVPTEFLVRLLDLIQKIRKLEEQWDRDMYHTVLIYS